MRVHTREGGAKHDNFLGTKGKGETPNYLTADDRRQKRAGGGEKRKEQRPV